LKCERVLFSSHAIQRMFQRGIARDHVKAVLSGGETIGLSRRQPYPSRLLLGFVERKPLHMVVAWDAGTGTCIVTAYEPPPEQWEQGYRKRR
jgi:hypothetical protein